MYLLEIPSFDFKFPGSLLGGIFRYILQDKLLQCGLLFVDFIVLRRQFPVMFVFERISFILFRELKMNFVCTANTFLSYSNKISVYLVDVGGIEKKYV